MNYEKIIVELLGRIQTLEEQMEMLLKNQNQTAEKKTNKITTEDIRKYIGFLKESAKKAGKETIVIRSGDLHRELNLKSRLPIVCNAMRQSMNDADVVLHTTPSGNSSTIEIEYKL